MLVSGSSEFHLSLSRERVGDPKKETHFSEKATAPSCAFFRAAHTDKAHLI